MTRRELGSRKDQFYASLETHDVKESIAEEVFEKVAAALEASWEENDRLTAIVAAAQKCVENLAWAGVCDEDVNLERALQALRGRDT